MMTFKIRMVVKIQGQDIVDLDRSEMAPRPNVLKPEDVSDKPC